MIRVLIERHFAEGMGDELRKGELAVRSETVRLPGYISGESLRDAHDPQCNVVIGTWRSRADWETWYGSPERQAAMEHIRMCLTEPEKITVLEPL